MMKTQLPVREWMSTPVYVIRPDALVSDAYNLMMKRSIRRLPVVDPENGKVVGLVTLGDLREARPSPTHDSASSLSIYELNYMLARLTVGEIMAPNPFTVDADTLIREAAQIMTDRKIGSLPVVDGEGKPIGIITESDIFRMLVDQWPYFSTPRVDPARVVSLLAQQVMMLR